MKPSINFENISHSEAEKLNLKKFRELHEKDYLPLTLKLWITFFAVGIFTMALICLAIINAHYIDTFSEKAIHYLNDLSTGAWTVSILIVMLCVLGLYRFKRKK